MSLLGFLLSKLEPPSCPCMFRGFSFFPPTFPSYSTTNEHVTRRILSKWLLVTLPSDYQMKKYSTEKAGSHIRRFRFGSFSTHPVLKCYRLLKTSVLQSSCWGQNDWLQMVLKYGESSIVYIQMAMEFSAQLSTEPVFLINYSQIT